jgi:hypothetical protein
MSTQLFTAKERRHIQSIKSKQLFATELFNALQRLIKAKDALNRATARNLAKREAEYSNADQAAREALQQAQV